MTTFCKVKVPKEIDDIVEANKDNEEAIKVRWWLCDCTHGAHDHVSEVKVPKEIDGIVEAWRLTRATRRPIKVR